MLPKDPVMLLSFINLKLRDFYPSLATLCDDLDIDRAEVDEKLAGIDYHYDEEKNPLYPRDLLQEVLLGLHSMCKGAESKFFNGHTNVTSHRFLVFGVKDLINGSLGVRNAMLFNLLSCLSDKLLTEGHTVAGLDELYIWLSNPTAVEYIRNTLKRVRKKESALLMASQNLEDFIYRAGLLQFAKTDCMGWVSVIESK